MYLYLYLRYFSKVSFPTPRYEFLPGNGYGEDHKPQVLETLLHYCPIEAPTWAELSHFASFLNVQLETTERSVFCNYAVVGEDSGLQGFKGVLVDFLITMSRDFGTRSIEISDQSQGENLSRPAISERRRWETAPHPYIFFNSDETYSFYGLHLQPADNRHMDLVDERSKAPLKRGVMSRHLYDGLRGQGVVFNRTFEVQKRPEKLKGLCQVFGVEETEPDLSYELTYDNIMKMLAITTRFRANIPVVMMGETGSGKTRLIRFMCALMRGGRDGVKNMHIMKIHGGIESREAIQ